MAASTIKKSKKVKHNSINKTQLWNVFDNEIVNENKKVDKIIRTINKRVNAENSKREYYHQEVFECHYYLCCCWCCDGTT